MASAAGTEMRVSTSVDYGTTEHRRSLGSCESPKKASDYQTAPYRFFSTTWMSTRAVLASVPGALCTVGGTGLVVYGLTAIPNPMWWVAGFGGALIVSGVGSVYLIYQFKNTKMLTEVAHDLQGMAISMAASATRFEKSATDFGRENTRLKGEADTFKTENTRLKGEVDTFKTENTRLNGEVTRLTNINLSLILQVENFQAANADLREQITTLTQTVKHLGIEAEEIKKENEELTKIREQLAKQVTDLGAQCEKLTDQLKVTDEKLQATEKRLSARVQELESVNARLQKAVDDFRKQNEALTANNKTLAQHIATFASAIADQQEDRTKMEALVAQLDNAKATIQSLTETQMALQARLDKSVGSLEKLVQELLDNREPATPGSPGATHQERIARKIAKFKAALEEMGLNVQQANDAVGQLGQFQLGDGKLFEHIKPLVEELRKVHAAQTLTGHKTSEAASRHWGPLVDAVKQAHYMALQKKTA